MWGSSSVMKMRDANLQVNGKSSLSHIFIHDYINSWLLFPKRLWKWASKISSRKYKRKVVLLVIQLFNYSSPKSTFFVLNMAFYVLVLTFWVQLLLYKLKFFVSCNSTILFTFLSQKLWIKENFNKAHLSFCSVFWC